MLYTKEFYEVMDFFENKASKEMYIEGSLTREDREQWKRQCYYTNGNANNYFKMFLSGYQLGKIS
jgi:hypothetical protein